MANQRKGQDLEAQTRDIRKQLNDQIGSLEFRTESKIALLNDLQEFFKRRSEVEVEYARGLDRLVEKCEKSTKQRNVKSELYSTQTLWNSLLGETRKVARERSALAEFYNTEMQTMLDFMLKDLHLVTKKCKEFCIEIQDKYLKELKELLEAMKAYQYSSHNTQEAYNKLCRSKEKLDAMKQSAKANSRRKEQLESKEGERQQQYKENQQRQIKFRNDYLLCLHSCNAYSNQYFNKDLLDLIEQMDYDYHGGLHRVAESYRETEHASCRNVTSAADALLDQANQLSFDSDLHAFLKENGVIFTQPTQFAFIPYAEDEEEEIKLTESLYNDIEESLRSCEEQGKTLDTKVAEETKTLQHMKDGLEKYKIVPCREPPPAGPDEPAEGVQNSPNLSASLSTEDARKTLSLERDRTSMLAPQNVRLQMFHNSQRGKKDEITYTLDVFHRKLQNSSMLSRVQAKHNLLKQAFEKAPPAAFASDIGPAYHLQELPKLFGGDLVTYIEVTRVKIPLIVTSCCMAIEARGLNVEGLFRVPGPAQHIEELRKDFEEGKNPFSIPGKEKYKSDINAIASTLKAYFRELQTPLFPMEKYTEFITCARKDSSERCTAIKNTVHTLHPSVVDVMAYLFKFLYKVSQHAHENKMNCSNLALVFGPTLVQAPTHLEALQLHNDVPAVNVLIQVCIEQHNVIFPTTTAATPPLPPTAEELNSQSLPPSPQVTPVSEGVTSETTQQQPVKETTTQKITDEGARVTSPQLTDQDIEETLNTTTTTTTSQPAPDLPDQKKQPQPTPPTSPVIKEQRKEEKPPLSPIATQQQPVATIDVPPQQEGNTEGPLSPKGKASITAKLIEKSDSKDEEDDVSDSDTDDDDDDVTTITVKAIYSYTARNQKELSFSAGEILQVTEKTSDGNWWDGFHDSQRGYIPVTYVEIMEVRSAIKSPLPPERRSSTQVGVTDAAETSSQQQVDDSDSSATNKQQDYPRQQSAPPMSPAASDKEFSPQPEPTTSPTPLSPTRLTHPPIPELSRRVSSPEAISTFKPVGANPVAANVQSATLPSRAKEIPTPVPPKMPSTGNVKNKMAQFLSSSQPHQSQASETPPRPPSPGHRRMKSEGSNLEYKSVKQLTQTYNPAEKAREYPPPPPTRPKPRPSAELTRNKEALEQAIAFPIMPHTAGVTQVSPLQQKLFSAVQTDPHQQQQQQQQQQQPKPAVLTKPKGSFRKHPKKVTKPPPPPQATAPPKGAFVAPPTHNPRDPTALHEELRAVASARTRKDKDTTV